MALIVPPTSATSASAWVTSIRCPKLPERIWRAVDAIVARGDRTRASVSQATPSTSGTQRTNVAT